MNKANSTGSIDRSARVRRIKRVLLGLVALIIILPTVLCICLFIKISKLEKEIYDLSLTKEKYNVVTEDTTIVEAKESLPEAKDVSLGTVVKKSEEAVVEEITDEEMSEDGTDETGVTEASEDAEVEGTDNGITTKRVYLTFDDGPSNNTPQILSILDEYGVKATFFVNGKEHESLKPYYKRIVDEGHAIGMHSYTHIYKQVYANKDAFNYDLDRVQAYIYEQTGVLPNIYRFPGGSSNQVSSTPMSELEDILSARGIKYYDWNVTCGDATSKYGLPADTMVNKVIDGVISNESEEAIVLMHDLPEKDTTVEALPRIIEKLQEMNVEILPIDENTDDFHHVTAE